MEQSHTGKRHCNSILVTTIDNEVVTERSARLSDILNTATLCANYVVIEGEECVATKSYSVNPGQILLLFCRGKGLGANGKVLLPYVVADYVLCILGKYTAIILFFSGRETPSAN